MIYLFVRPEVGFYPLDLGSDDEAIANAECNPGTLKVLNAITEREVWSDDRAADFEEWFQALQSLDPIYVGGCQNARAWRDYFEDGLTPKDALAEDLTNA